VDVFGHIFLGKGVLPECFDLHYKIQLVSDHVAKFHGDRPRELGDMVVR